MMINFCCFQIIFGQAKLLNFENIEVINCFLPRLLLEDVVKLIGQLLCLYMYINHFILLLVAFVVYFV